MAEQHTTKRQRTGDSHPVYELLYHPVIPGRGEFIRLAFEATGTPYHDIANDSTSGGYNTVQKICINPTSLESDDGNPPVFAPPALRVTTETGGSQKKKVLIISQTANILIYLGEKLGLVPTGSEGVGSDEEGEEAKFYIQQLALTALDLSNEIHDTHHPIAVMQYYEDQKAESLKKAVDVRENRIPKFLSYFERQLKWNALQGKKTSGQEKKMFLVGEKLTYADLTVWQVLDGMRFAFPKEMEARRKEFPELLEGFYESVKEEKGVKEYLASERRKPYSQGMFRYYPELDRQ